MCRVNRQVQGAPWRAVLEHADSQRARQARARMTSLDRANWRLFLPLPTAGTVLDIGAGLGTIAHALAESCHRVIALEPAVERVEFMHHRFRQEGVRNVSVVRGDVHRLSIRPNSVDLAVLDGVLPWIPWREATRPPREAQVQALRRIHEVLRPGGLLCMGIDNRWALAQLAGTKDPHVGLPYVAILPRPLASLWTRWKTGLPYRSYTYSVFGYRRLLREAGFAVVQTYCAMPTHRVPHFIFPFDDRLFAHFARKYDAGRRGPERALRRALRWLRIDKYVVDSFFLVGRK